MRSAHLRSVPAAPEPTPEDALSSLVPELLAAEREVARLRNALTFERRRLASERGVAFIREERVRAEFAHG